jgi:hypothetical protein
MKYCGAGHARQPNAKAAPAVNRAGLCLIALQVARSKCTFNSRVSWSTRLCKYQ